MAIDVDLRGDRETARGLKDLSGDLDKVERSARTADSRGLGRFRRGLDDTRSRADRFRGVLAGPVRSALLGIGRWAAIGAAAASAAIAGLAGAAIGLASDATEAADAFRMTVPARVRAAMALSRRYVDAFSGYTRAEIDQMSAMFFGQLGGALSGRQIGRLMTVGVDLESVFNLEQGSGQQVLQSLLAGEAEVGRRFGIDISQAAVDSSKFAKSLGKTMQQMTQAEKQQAFYNIVLADTAAFQNNARDTSDSFANTVRGLKADVKDFGAEVGLTLLPYAQDLAAWAREMVSTHGPAFRAWLKNAVDSVVRFAETVNGFVQRAGGWKAWLTAAGVGLAALTVALAAAAVALAVLSVAAAGVTVAMVAIPAAIALVVGGLVWLYNNNETVASGLRVAWEGLKVAWWLLVAAIVNGAAPAVDGLLLLASTILRAASAAARLAGNHELAGRLSGWAGDADRAREGFQSLRATVNRRIKAQLDSSSLQVAYERVARFSEAYRQLGAATGISLIRQERAQANRGRAVGGTVHPGVYRVGERGPENVFIPAIGQVDRNDEVRRGGDGATVGRAIEIPVVIDGREVARATVDGIRALDARR